MQKYLLLILKASNKTIENIVQLLSKHLKKRKQIVITMF